MDSVTVRARFGAAVEWVIAAAFLAATLTVGSLILRELRAEPSPAGQAPVVSATPALPPSVPERAVSIQSLPLADGSEVKVGETLSTVSARLGRAAESGRQEIDRGALGERLTRFYEREGVRFILVFEPFERRGEPRVAAIYLP